MTRAAIGRGLYALLTPEVLPVSDFPGAARALADLGVPVIQIRTKTGDDRERLALQRAVARALPAAFGGLLIVNDRADLARVLAFENPHVRVGLHLGQTDLAPGLARSVVGSDVVIGLSTHDEAQVAAAVSEPVDYVAFGPIYATSTKVNPDPVVGLDGLARARLAVGPRVLVAIGGIDGGRAREVFAAGADLVAVASALFSGALDDDALGERVRAFDSAGQGGRDDGRS